MTTEINQVFVNIEDEIRRSYLDYSMSVIIGRALPDVRDGLKPVHRRILYAMFRANLLSNRKHSKCAAVVGEVLGKYHPHGDSAVYDALVRLAQQWNLRYPLINGQGNFGSIDGDPAAAYRYTEARLTKLAELMLQEIDRDTVDFTPNFDDTTEEPVVLPARLPNLLVNGSSGIAVGMATNIPPHNISEIIDAAVHLARNPDAPIEELLKMVPGPDFPTGGIICGKDKISQAYMTGRGTIKVRAKHHLEELKKDRWAIIISEVPYQVNKARMLEQMAALVKDGKIEGIGELRDESDRDGMRVVIELKRDAPPSQVIVNQLHKHTQMQTSFGINMLAIVRGQPRLLSLREMLQHFIDHRREVVMRRTNYDLRKARERAHILEGFKKALDMLDLVIQTIRSSRTVDEANTRLVGELGFSDIQAKAILELRLQRLTGLEREKIIEELREVHALIARLEAILASEELLLDVIVQELEEVRKDHGDERRTVIEDAVDELSIEDLIAEEDMVVTVSSTGYIKRAPVSAYRSQRRGGRGRAGMRVREEDFVAELFIASTHSYILVFTTTGRCYWLKVHEVPQPGLSARGRPIANLVELKQDDKLAAVLPVREFREGQYIMLATRKGIIKKTSLMQFSNPRPSGIIALNVEEGDVVVSAKITEGAQEVFLGTKKGMAIRFPERQVRPMGRASRGVRGISLDSGDEVVSCEILSGGTSLLTVTQHGYGKRTRTEEYRLQRRGGKGLITIKTTERNGDVVGVLQVFEDDEVVMVTDRGITIRVPVKGISLIGRNTQGVRLISMEEGERLVSVARIPERNLDETPPKPTPPAPPLSASDNGAEDEPLDDDEGLEDDTGDDDAGDDDAGDDDAGDDADDADDGDDQGGEGEP